MDGFAMMSNDHQGSMRNHHHNMQYPGNDMLPETKPIVPRPNTLLDDKLEADGMVDDMGNRINTLALRLQQRRTRKVLADQGIIPPLKSPGAYYEQIQKLERARTGDFLNKKMQDRPDREHLVQKHILEDTNAYDSLVAHQKELKKAQLVDDLNEKIFNRPGVFELVEKNILPADETVAQALAGGHVQYKKTKDFVDDDSSDAFSPEMPSSHDQGTSYGSPPPSFSSSPLPAVTSTAWAEHKSMAGPVSKQDTIMVTASSSSKMVRSTTSTHTTAGHPYLFRKSSNTKSSKISPSALSQRNLQKKKEKPKFKKFKYHQYIPPDQQGKSTEQSMPDMDTPYSRLLEQQQLYLQLQIMNQQYPSLMQNQKSPNGSQMQEPSKNFAVPPAPPAPPSIIPKAEKKKRSFTVQQLEDMKVAELKEELKARKEKVTGTKEVLVERLRRFAIPNPIPPPSNQPISESITGLINATIQSTIRANTEHALAAAVNNNGAAGTILLKSRTPPAQTKQETPQANNANPTPPANLPNSSVPGQRVIAPAPSLQFKSDISSQPFDYSERQKDEILHKQQQEIEDLRRMVELHRTQLHQFQEKERSKHQDVPNMNNNTSNMILTQTEQPEQVTMNMVEQSMKRQHISQVLQKHLHNRLNSKDQPMMPNGLNQQMLVKQEIPGQVEENVFSFATMPPNVSLMPLQSVDNSSTVQEDSPIILSIKPPVERSLSESKEPPKYDQAIQMLNEEKRRLSHHSFGSQENMAESPANQNDLTNADMDDLLELLENKGEIPVTPTRQKAFPQTVVIEGRIPQHATMHYHHPFQPQQQQQAQLRGAAINNHRRSVDQLQRAISANEIDNMTQQSHRRSLELPALISMSSVLKRKDPNVHRRHSGDILDQHTQRRHSGDLLSYNDNHTGLTPLFSENQNDFTSLLVSSAGDILMDASHVPPSNLQGRMSLPTCISPEAVALHQEPIMPGSNQVPQDDPSKSNAYLNLSDPYATQPFSPMDTGSSDAHSRNGMMEERVRDPHLSSSSIHDSRQSLDKCLDSVPQSTGSYLRRYEQPLAGASPQRHPHSHLIKSSSQELLSGHVHVSGFDHSMQVDELGWLDLTLSSPHHAPPSPMNLQQQHRASMHSSMGSVLEHETGGTPYNLSGEGLGSHNEFDLIDSLDLNSIGNAGIDPWDGL